MNTTVTTDIRHTNPTARHSEKQLHPARMFFVAGLIGLVVGVLFILVQPWFGMDTLTSRHAAAYQQLGGWSATPALFIAWLAHLAVSVAYGWMGGVVVMAVSRWSVIALWTVVFSWVTTVIAPPANALIVQLVSFQQLTASKLPPLNFSFDEKLALHFVVFGAITAALMVYRRK